MTRRIRVVLMIDEATIGGGQQHVLALAENLDRSRFDITVACASAGYLVDELHKRRIRTIPVRMSNRPDIWSLLDCARRFRQVRPDIVHTHGGTAGFTGRVASLFFRGVRRVHSYHGLHYLHTLQSVRSQVFRVIDRVLRRVSHRLVCVAKSDYERGMQHGVVDASRGVVIHLGIDVEKFGAQNKRAGIANPAPRIVGTIGRLHVQKGHRYLLEAAVLVIKNNPRVRFVIVGGGALQAETEGWIKRLGLEKHVELLGPRTDIPALLVSMDLFVLSSLWEGLPLVLLEAMAAGKPIVSTAVDGVTEVITNEEALLVPPRNPEKLAEAILKILNDPDLAQQLRERAMQKVRREFSVERMVGEMEKLYTDLVSPRSPDPRDIRQYV